MNNREFVSTIGTLRQPENVSAAKWCRQNDIGVGTVLAGDEGHGVCLLLITAIGERQILGRAIERRGEPVVEREGLWKLACRDWVRVEGWFVADSGTRHRASRYDPHEAACSSRVRRDSLVVQRPVKDCKRCYPKGRVES